MLTMFILQVYNIDVSNKMLENSYEGSLDKLFVIQLYEGTKMVYLKKFSTVNR